MRNATKTLAALAVVLLLLPVSQASAQRRRGLADITQKNERHGFWINFNVAAGGENFRYTKEAGCNGVIGAYQRCEALFKPAASIALGGTVNPQLRLGGELNTWWYEHNSADFGHVTSYLVGGLLTAQFFPVRTLGLFAKGGVGITRSGEDYADYSGIGETGFGYLIGAGYEIKVAHNLFLTPNFNLMRHVSSIAAADDPLNSGSFHERVITFGVGLTYQPGR